jgi:hypothetical protein
LYDFFLSAAQILEAASDCVIYKPTEKPSLFERGVSALPASNGLSEKIHKEEKMKSRFIPIGIVLIAALAAAGCSNPLASTKDSPADSNGEASSRGFQYINPVVFNGIDQGMELPNVDAQKLASTFRIELIFSVAERQLQPYATILDINHRDGIGVVIQQDGTKNNTFVFAAGDGGKGFSLTYSFKPGRCYAVVFEKIDGALRLEVQDTASPGECDIMRASIFAGGISMPKDASFLPGSYPTLGFNRNYGRYFNGTIYYSGFYSCRGFKRSMTFDGTAKLPGDPALSGDPAEGMRMNFVLEMGIVPRAAQNDYATILDVNHRDNVGIVIQQNGSRSNEYCFGIGYGSGGTVLTGYLKPDNWHSIEFRRIGRFLRIADNSTIIQELNTQNFQQAYFLPGSTATIGYNLNFGRVFNGIISYAYVWTPVI